MNKLVLLVLIITSTINAQNIYKLKYSVNSSDSLAVACSASTSSQSHNSYSFVNISGQALAGLASAVFVSLPITSSLSLG